MLDDKSRFLRWASVQVHNGEIAAKHRIASAVRKFDPRAAALLETVDDARAELAAYLRARGVETWKPFELPPERRTANKFEFDAGFQDGQHARLPLQTTNDFYWRGYRAGTARRSNGSDKSRMAHGGGGGSGGGAAAVGAGAIEIFVTHGGVASGSGGRG